MQHRLFVLALVPLSVMAADWNVRDHISLNHFIVQSHRGAGDLMPENSVEAFALSWKLGAVPEADLRTTSDGVIVAFHDNDFRRILPNAPAERQKLGIGDLSWAEVAALDIGAWKGEKFAGQRVPRLSSICQLLAIDRTRRVYIDIKNVDLEQLARETGAVNDRLILASTDYALIRHWKRLAPQSPTILWMGGTEEALAKRLEELRKTHFEAVNQLQIHVHAAADGTLAPSPEFLRRTGSELREHGILFQVLPWQSKDAAVYRRLLELGVASFATDYPDVVMRAVREYYGEERPKK
jgi:glycerophosphoryl diester phosphodiesterase